MIDQRLAREIELKTNTIRAQLDFYGLSKEQREVIIHQITDLASTIAETVAEGVRRRLHEAPR